MKRYAAGEVGKAWAVVTGASDGIGAAYCVELARIGFNVALVSRTMSKLLTVEGECKKANPLIQTRIVQADFCNTNRPKDSDVLKFYANLKEKLNDLNIAILVNNAGLMFTGRIDETPLDSQKWKDIIDVNVMHVGMMNATF